MPSINSDLEFQLAEARATIVEAMFALAEAWPYVHGASVSSVSKWNRRAKERCHTTLSPHAEDVFLWEDGQWVYRKDCTMDLIAIKSAQYRLLGHGTHAHSDFFTARDGYHADFGVIRLEVITP